MSIRIGIGLDVFGAGIDANAQTIYNRIIADGGVSNLTRLNFFVKGLKAIYGDLANVPVCYDAHWIGYKLGSGTGATAGQAAAKLYSLTVAGDAVQAIAASQPLLLAHNGASSDNYWWGSGVSGNYVSTPNAAANQITGDIEIIVYKAKFDYTNNYSFVAKSDTASNRNYLFAVESGILKFYQSFDGTAFVSATCTSSLTTAGYLATNDIWLKLTRNSNNGQVVFFGSADGITFAQIGSTITTTTGSRFNSTVAVNVGNWNNTAYFYLGKISRLTISNSIGGAPVVDFNPAQYNASTSQTAWTSSTGEVWTINTGTATTGYKGVLVDRTIVQSDGVDDQLKTTSVSITTSSRYSAINPFVLTSGYMISGLNGGVGDRQLTYLSATTLREYSLGSQINYSGFVASKLQILQSTYNGASSQVSINNINNVTGTLTADALDTIVIFSNLSASFKNMILNTLVIPSVIDNSTTRTATYNLLKTLNNL